MDHFASFLHSIAYQSGQFLCRLNLVSFNQQRSVNVSKHKSHHTLFPTDLEFDPRLNLGVDGDALVDLLVLECVVLMKV